ncbi:MAG: neutral/alkaline non-lysosomal ceramidase N-terminal domain-containing protein [Pirellulaceae bacterium]|nr:neutral/alkaline non-lysosomal ceramidase N-terminal domain-containing protein [Pirellulaceae bacterium]
MKPLFTPLWMLLLVMQLALELRADDAANGTWRVGLAKVDITPTEPVRLSGYSGRVESHTAVADPLHVRAICLTPQPVDSAAATPPTLVLVSVDSIALPAQITDEIAGWLQEKHSIGRAQLVLCSTHSHTAPHLPGNLQNLFQVSSTEQQIQAAERYAVVLKQALRRAIEHALGHAVAGAQVEIGQSTVDFAVHRRVIRDGRWTGFGIQEGGPVDHRVHILRVTGHDGALLGAVYQYACHCTTLGQDFNQISGDWAGLSASRLEDLNPGAVFLPIIGCGGDANPNPRGSYEGAMQNGLQMVDAVRRGLREQNWSALQPPTQIQYGLVGLEPEQPTAQAIQHAADSDDPNQRRWAIHMQATRLKMGRLPESCPMPVHAWIFGEQLSWIFLGGEVVVEYQFALEKEFSTEHTWVAAYTDEVVGYVASESQRSEGGYEVDYSMIFYLQPGRWQSGTQSDLVSRVRQISQQQRGQDQPLDPQTALQSIHVPDDYRVELVAAEPLVQDPVNIAFGWDGRVWVAQMSDYPLGIEAGGSIRILEDSDDDGQLDRSTPFLQGLSYPTSVQPWRGGAIVIAAPDIFFAEDTDGDGVADVRRTLLSGVAEVNPQHRASGFEIGLDGRLHFAVGEGTRKLYSHLNDKTYDVRGHDVVWNPDTGEVEVFVPGNTQFVPARDAFGDWFGNHNAEPMYQFVFQSADLGGRLVESGSVQHLLEPAVAPPVYPRSRTTDRFNDLFTRDRYTSACSSIIVRVPGLSSSAVTAHSSQPVALVCEPVHNLVARLALQCQGSAFTATRHPEDAAFDFFASSDPWSRPVRVVNAPDDSLWIVDMYRQVIEHPQWIPTAWQARLNVRGGDSMGRIYRVYHRDHKPKLPGNLARARVLDLLQSPNGAIRDLAMQAVVTDQIPQSELTNLPGEIRQLFNRPPAAAIYASLLGVMSAKGWLMQADLASALASANDPQLVRLILKLAGQWDVLEDQLQAELQSVVGGNWGSAVDLQWVLSSQKWTGFPTQAGLSQILGRGQPDRWLNAALSFTSAPQSAEPVLRMSLATADKDSSDTGDLQQPLATIRRLVGLLTQDQRQSLVDEYFLADRDVSWLASRVLLLVSLYPQPSDAKIQRLEELSQQAIGALSEGGRDIAERQRLGLLLGNEVLAATDELAIARQLLNEGPAATDIIVRRARYLRSDELAELLLELWSQLGHNNQSSVASALLLRPAWREALVTALESGNVQRNQLPPAAVQALVSHYDRNLRSRAAAVFGRPSPRQSIVNDYLNRMPNPSIAGQVDLGQQLYREHCGVCHSVQEGRPPVGPAIDNLSHWNNEQWLTAILDPSLAVEEKYKQTLILTEDQEAISGIVVDETDTQLRILTSDGLSRTILVEDVQQRQQSNVSLMPEGFEARLTPDQLAHIVQYLRAN